MPLAQMQAQPPQLQPPQRQPPQRQPPQRQAKLGPAAGPSRVSSTRSRAGASGSTRLITLSESSNTFMGSGFSTTFTVIPSGTWMPWERSASLVSAERGDLLNEFIEITEDEANQIVARIRAEVTGPSNA